MGLRMNLDLPKIIRKRTPLRKRRKRRSLRKKKHPNWTTLRLKMSISLRMMLKRKAKKF
jgi:hypothetical protein